jgi:ubiquitin conjugation factor E4 B
MRTHAGGPKGIELKVEHPEEYNFRPKQLLLEACQCILRLAPRARFQRCVAESGFFNEEKFEKIFALIERINLLPKESSDGVSLAGFRKFISDVKLAFAQSQDEDDLYSDPPEEFKDPIMLELMKDPVRAPSGFVFDRAIILQQILNTPTDPFTRQPLCAEDLVPEVQLKARIDAWMAERRQARANGTASSS